MIFFKVLVFFCCYSKDSMKKALVTQGMASIIRNTPSIAMIFCRIVQDPTEMLVKYHNEDAKIEVTIITLPASENS